MSKKINDVRLANYVYADRCSNLVEVVAKEDANSKDVKMHLNVAGLVKAIQTNVLVSAKRPDEKKLELLLSQLSSICKNDKKFDEMKAKIVNLLGE